MPKITILSLGGTIAMTSDGGQGVRPKLTAEALVASVPQLIREARLEARSFRQLPGAHLSFDDLIALATEVDDCAARGNDGVVITQGTDTIEEVAFALDLLVQSPVAVVVTGAMRNPDLPGADGPANLLAAVQAAADPRLRGTGVVVVLDDAIHTARYVQKAHTHRPSAFVSPVTGPLGWIAEGRVRLAASVWPGIKLSVTAQRPDAPVALLPVSLDEDGRLLEAVLSGGFGGLVLEGVGAGHVPAKMVDRIQRVADRMPVVLATRIGIGEVLRNTYGFEGSETDLLRRGLIPAGILDGPKARILLSLLLKTDAAPGEIAGVFDSFLE